MRIPRTVVWMALTQLVLGACSLTEPDAYGIWFDVDGTPDSVNSVNAAYQSYQNDLTIGGVGYATSSELELQLRNYAGSTRSYPITQDQGPYSIFPPGTIVSASLRRSDGHVYDTGAFGGSGQIAVTKFECYLRRGLEHGLEPSPVCAVNGTFAFTARSSEGDTIRVTDGRFRVLAQQY